MKSFRILAVVFVVALATSQATHVAAGVMPPNLPPGSQYQLAFVTAGTTTATSSDIAFYDTFVRAEAALNPELPQSVTWDAVGTTAAVMASVNAPSAGLPVYNTAGVEVASAATGLYASTLLSPIDFDQYGNLSFTTVWTGVYSVFDDSLHPGSLGFPNDGNVLVGNTNPNAGSLWIAGAVDLATNQHSLYALSTPITVPTPEPATLALAAIAGLSAVAFRKRFVAGHLRAAVRRDYGPTRPVTGPRFANSMKSHDRRGS